MSSLKHEVAVLRAELPSHVAALKDALFGAAERLYQTPTSFSELTVTAKNPINQDYAQGSSIICYSDRVSPFNYGDFNAIIREDIPEKALYRAESIQPPFPYIPRRLTMYDGLLTVTTSTKRPFVDNGPLLTQSFPNSCRLLNRTTYDTKTDTTKVVSGITYTPETLTNVTRISSEDIAQFSYETQARRFATLDRTVKSATHMLAHAAIRTRHDIKATVL